MEGARRGGGKREGVAGAVWREPAATGPHALATVSYSSRRPRLARASGEGSKRLAEWALAALILASFAFRAFVAPYSSGSDIPQFAGFGDTMNTAAWCFYVSASNPRGEPWPYPWLYPYGPPLALALGVVARLVDARPSWGWESGVYVVRVPPEWIVPVKALFIAGDAAATIFIYLLARRKVTRTQALAVAAAYAASPAAVYISAIYGMFDQMAVALLLASLYVRGPAARGVFAALAALTKPTLTPAALAAILAGSERVKAIVYMAATLSVVLAPFVLLCPDSVKAMEAIIAWRGGPRPPLPSVYSFSWMGSIVAYYYETRGVDYSWILRAWPAVAAALAPLTLYAARRGPILAALAAYTWFLASSWSVNYQFLVPLLALTLAAYEYMPCRSSKAMAAVLWAHVSVWPVLFPSEFWFKVHTEGMGTLAGKIVEWLTLDKMYGGSPSLVYSLVLGALEIAMLASLALCRSAFQGVGASPARPSLPRVGQR